MQYTDQYIKSWREKSNQKTANTILGSELNFHMIYLIQNI